MSIYFTSAKCLGLSEPASKLCNDSNAFHIKKQSRNSKAKVLYFYQ